VSKSVPVELRNAKPKSERLDVLRHQTGQAYRPTPSTGKHPIAGLSIWKVLFLVLS
jgi:hypothetical protein